MNCRIDVAMHQHQFYMQMGCNAESQLGCFQGNRGKINRNQHMVFAFFDFPQLLISFSQKIFQNRNRYPEVFLRNFYLHRSAFIFRQADIFQFALHSLVFQA